MTPAAVQYQTVSKCDQLREECPGRTTSKIQWVAWGALVLGFLTGVLSFNSRLATVEANYGHINTALSDIKTALNDMHPREGE